MTFAGFPRRTRYTPVPNPLFGALLEQIDDLAELKCTLRIVWMLYRKRGHPRFVTLRELLADRSLARSLRADEDPRAALDLALAQAVQRGTLIRGTVQESGRPETAFALNSEADREALAKVLVGSHVASDTHDAAEWESPGERPNIFALYEQNIGILSPIIADELREAEELYPAEWIEAAIKEAVAQNALSWRYAARILERWEREGRHDGGTRRHSEKAAPKRYY